MAILGSLTCFILYIIGKTVFNTKSGVIASLILAHNPIMLLYSRRAMANSPLIFFMSLNTLLLIYMYKSICKEKFSRALFFSILMGVTIALATGTKLNGGLTLVVLIGFALTAVIIKLLHHFARRNDPIGKYILILFTCVLLAVVIACFVFIYINPYLYANPVKNILNMTQFRLGVTSFLQNRLDDPIFTWNQKFNFVIKRTLFAGTETLSVFGNALRFSTDFILFLIGFFMMVFLELKHILREGQLSEKSIILIWTIITFAGIIVWIPFDWARYYLPVMPCVAMMIGYGLSNIFDGCWLTLRRIKKGGCYGRSSRN